MKRVSERKKRRIERTLANDRSYKLFLYNRFFIFLVLVLFQLVLSVWLMYAFAYSSKAAAIVRYALNVVSLAAILYLINHDERPSSKLNWILFMLLFPVVGVPTYLLYGEGRPTRGLRKKMEQTAKDNDAALLRRYGEPQQRAPEKRADTLSSFLYDHAGYPAFYGGDVEYYDGGEKAFAAMKEELSKAEKFILMDYFIIAHGKMWGEILSILLERAEAGVQVRLIYDDFGCMMTLPPKYAEYLESLHPNVKAMRFNPVVPLFAVRMNNRDHRKIMVVDGKVAFTGGINLADEYIGEKMRFGHWKDSCVRVRGNAVSSFTRMFFRFWNALRKDTENVEDYLPVWEEEEGEITIQPYDDSPLETLSIGENVYLDMCERAKKYVYIFTPYLILDDGLRAAICRAALRGVDVRIVTPGIPDKKTVYRLTRANYGILMKAGVKIYEYTPGFIHAKSVLCDGESAVVGTFNFDYRSLVHHFENAVYFSNCAAVDALKRDCDETFAVSKLCTPENTKRSVLGKLWDSLLRVFETLL